MKPDRCSFCKGKLVEGKTEFVAKVGEQIIAIKEPGDYILILISLAIRTLFRRYFPPVYPPPVYPLVLRLFRYIPLLLYSGPVF